MTVLAAAITRQDGIVISADSQISWDWAKSDEGPGKLWVEKDRKYILLFVFQTTEQHILTVLPFFC